MVIGYRRSKIPTLLFPGTMANKHRKYISNLQSNTEVHVSAFFLFPEESFHYIVSAFKKGYRQISFLNMLCLGKHLRFYLNPSK